MPLGHASALRGLQHFCLIVTWRCRAFGLAKLINNLVSLNLAVCNSANVQYLCDRPLFCHSEKVTWTWVPYLTAGLCAGRRVEQ